MAWYCLFPSLAKANVPDWSFVPEEIPDPNSSPRSDDQDTTFPGGKVIEIIVLIANL